MVQNYTLQSYILQKKTCTTAANQARAIPYGAKLYPTKLYSQKNLVQLQPSGPVKNYTLQNYIVQKKHCTTAANQSRAILFSAKLYPTK